jgi:hypothetical protein
MAISKYVVYTKFVFEGRFFVKAENKEEAKRIVKEDCGLTIGGPVHSTQDEDTVYWDFPVHPEKIIGGIF